MPATNSPSASSLKRSSYCSRGASTMLEPWFHFFRSGSFAKLGTDGHLLPWYFSESFVTTLHGDVQLLAVHLRALCKEPSLASSVLGRTHLKDLQVQFRTSKAWTLASDRRRDNTRTLSDNLANFEPKASTISKRIFSVLKSSHLRSIFYFLQKKWDFVKVCRCIVEVSLKIPNEGDWLIVQPLERLFHHQANNFNFASSWKCEGGVSKSSPSRFHENFSIALREDDTHN